MRGRVVVCLLALLIALGCAQPTTLHEPGALGPFGVELLERSFRVRVDESISALVLLPVGSGVSSAPLALVIQGGAVPVERYRWMGERLASRGMVVVMPRHALDLAIFQSSTGLDAIEAMHRASADPGDPLFGRVDAAPGLALGHSLGGVLAISHWLRAPERIRHLAVFAGQPNPDDRFSRASAEPGARVVTIGGTVDARISPAAIFESFAAYEPGGTLGGVPVDFVEVVGMNHFQLTDDATAENLASDGVPSLGLEPAREAAFFLVDGLADELVEGTPTRRFDDPTLWPVGLQRYEAP